MVGKRAPGADPRGAEDRSLTPGPTTQVGNCHLKPLVGLSVDLDGRSPMDLCSQVYLNSPPLVWMFTT